MFFTSFKRKCSKHCCQAVNLDVILFLILINYLPLPVSLTMAVVRSCSKMYFIKTKIGKEEGWKKWRYSHGHVQLTTLTKRPHFATNYSVFNTLSSTPNVFLILFSTHYHPNVFFVMLCLCHFEPVSLPWNWNSPSNFLVILYVLSVHVICQKRLMKQLHSYETYIIDFFLFFEEISPTSSTVFLHRIKRLWTKIYVSICVHDIRTKILRQSIWLYFRSFANIRGKHYPREKQKEIKQVYVVAKMHKYFVVSAYTASCISGAAYPSKAPEANCGLWFQSWNASRVQGETDASKHDSEVVTSSR
jgi:hypothetical protein